MKFPATLLLVFGLSACAIGSPPGFSDGDNWGFPLVGPLESGTLLAPVKINGKGPWLFAIDPDLGVSAVDPGIQSELQLMPEPGIQVLNHDDNLKPFPRARVNEIEVGDLRVRNRVVFVKPATTIRGRWVRGVLGRDVIAPSLVFAVDRDRGMAYLGTQGHLKAPATAHKIEYRLVADRFLTTVKVNGDKEAMLHLDFGNHTSTIWESKQKDMGLKRVEQQGVLRDEFGFQKQTGFVGLADTVNLGAATGSSIAFAPMGDKRISEIDYDGELGQNFFHPYNFTINFHHTSLWLKPRTKDVAGTARERMRRWGSRFDKCRFAACVKAELEPMGGKVCPEAGAQASPAGSGEPAPDAVAGAPAPTAEPCVAKDPDFYQLKIGREAPGVGLEYEVALLPVDESGKPIDAEPLIASLGKGAQYVYHPLRDPRYAAAKTFLAIDVSPFPRGCEKVGAGYRCAWPLK